MVRCPCVDVTGVIPQHCPVDIVAFNKTAAGIDPAARQECEAIMRTIYAENPAHWPHGLDIDTHLVGGDSAVYLIRDRDTAKSAGFVGWQEFDEGGKRVGYYSIGILPEYRNRGFAKEAVAAVIEAKSANVDSVRAYIVDTNTPSLGLAASLGVPVDVVEKSAAAKKLIEAAEAYDRLGGVARTYLRNKHVVNALAGAGANTALWQDEHTTPRIMALNALIGALGGVSMGGALPNVAMRSVGRGAAKAVRPVLQSAEHPGTALSAGLGAIVLTPAKDLLVRSNEMLPGVKEDVSTIAAAAGQRDLRLPLAVLGAGAAAGAGIWAGSRALARMADRAQDQRGRVRLRLPTKNPNDTETEIDIPIDDLALSNNLMGQLTRDTRRRLRAEGKERTQRRPARFELADEDDPDVIDVMAEKVAAAMASPSNPYGMVRPGAIPAVSLAPPQADPAAAEQQQQQMAQQQADAAAAEGDKIKQMAQLESVKLENQHLKNQLQLERERAKPTKEQGSDPAGLRRRAEAIRKAMSKRACDHAHLMDMLDRRLDQLVKSAADGAVKVETPTPAPTAPAGGQAAAPAGGSATSSVPATGRLAQLSRAPDASMQSRLRTAYGIEGSKMDDLKKFYDESGNLTNQAGLANYLTLSGMEHRQNLARQGQDRLGSAAWWNAAENWANSGGGSREDYLKMTGKEYTGSRGFGVGNDMLDAADQAWNRRDYATWLAGSAAGNTVDFLEGLARPIVRNMGFRAMDAAEQARLAQARHGGGDYFGKGVVDYLGQSAMAVPHTMLGSAQGVATFGVPGFALGKSLLGTAGVGTKLLGAALPIGMGMATDSIDPGDRLINYSPYTPTPDQPAGLSASPLGSVAPNAAQQLNLGGLGYYSPLNPAQSGIGVTPGMYSASQSPFYGYDTLNAFGQLFSPTSSLTPNPVANQQAAMQALGYATPAQQGGNNLLQQLIMLMQNPMFAQQVQAGG